MDALLVLSLALSGLIGFALGAFGGGGSILAVPMLVFVTRVAPSAAVGMSLAIVGATSLVAGYAHHRRGQVRLKVALVFGGAGILTAFFGARLTHFVAGDVLMLSFAALMVLFSSPFCPWRRGLLQLLRHLLELRVDGGRNLSTTLRQRASEFKQQCL